MAEEEIEGSVTGEFIVPSKAIGELSRLLSAAGEVSIRQGETQVEFTLTQEGL